jgi:hypothetical protein
MFRDAMIDLTGFYRYSLTRCWDDTKGRVVFVLLNPSTADEVEDDKTLNRCIDFAKCWGFGSLEIVNLFAYRTKDPKILKNIKDYNPHYIQLTRDGYPRHPSRLSADLYFKPMRFE